MRVLHAFAAAVEAGPLAGDARTLRIGVGKAAAAATLARRLAADPVDAVIGFGVAGVYPRADAPSVGELVLVARETFGDEGVETPGGFLSLRDLGLGDDTPLEADAALVARVSAALGGLRTVSGATVSTCSGTDARARALADRTGAIVETMEGAAIALVCREAGVPWVQLRAISNRTGDRDRAGWDLPRAAGVVQAAVRMLLEGGW
jgi:futalosine hydrolase